MGKKKKRRVDRIPEYNILIGVPNRLIPQAILQFKEMNDSLPTIQSLINRKYPIIINLLDNRNRLMSISNAVIPRTRLILGYKIYLKKIPGLTEEMQYGPNTSELEEETKKIIDLNYDSKGILKYKINNNEIRQDNFMLSADVYVIQWQTILDNSATEERQRNYYENEIKALQQDLKRKDAEFEKIKESTKRPYLEEIKDLKRSLKQRDALIKRLQMDEDDKEIEKLLETLGYEDSDSFKKRNTLHSSGDEL
ncbi:MAG: hypothetical protein ACFFAS_06935 [Promethearchaeota archaeon]